MGGRGHEISQIDLFFQHYALKVCLVTVLRLVTLIFQQHEKNSKIIKGPGVVFVAGV